MHSQPREKRGKKGEKTFPLSLSAEAKKEKEDVAPPIFNFVNIAGGGKEKKKEVNCQEDIDRL